VRNIREGDVSESHVPVVHAAGRASAGRAGGWTRRLPLAVYVAAGEVAGGRKRESRGGEHDAAGDVRRPEQVGRQSIDLGTGRPLDIENEESAALERVAGQYVEFTVDRVRGVRRLEEDVLEVRFERNIAAGRLAIAVDRDRLGVEAGRTDGISADRLAYERLPLDLRRRWLGCSRRIEHGHELGHVSGRWMTARSVRGQRA